MKLALVFLFLLTAILVFPLAAQAEEHDPPAQALSYEIVDGPSGTVQFTLTGFSGDFSVWKIRVVWNFSDGGAEVETINALSIFHTFVEKGAFNVSATVFTSTIDNPENEYRFDPLYVTVLLFASEDPPANEDLITIRLDTLRGFLTLSLVLWAFLAAIAKPGHRRGRIGMLLIFAITLTSTFWFGTGVWRSLLGFM